MGMKFNARGGISILELIVYFPSLVIAVLICLKHGFTRSSGWIYLAIFSLIRFVGACVQLATYDNESKGLFQAAAIIDSIALSPLLLATLGLLSRCTSDSTFHLTGRKAPLTLPNLPFRALQILITVALILGIVGGNSSNITPAGGLKVASTMKVAIALFVVAYGLIVLLFLHTLFLGGPADIDAKRILLAVGVSLPILAVRIVYSILSVFSHDQTFNLLDGKVVAWVFMAVVEEFIIVAIYLVAGWMAPVLTRSAPAPKQGGQNGGPAQQRGMKFSASRGGLVGNLVGMGVDAARNHQANRNNRDVEAGQ